MIRDALVSSVYRNARVEVDENSIAKSWELLKNPAANAQYEHQYTFDLAERYLWIMLRMYSRDDEVN